MTALRLYAAALLLLLAACGVPDAGAPAASSTETPTALPAPLSEPPAGDPVTLTPETAVTPDALPTLTASPTAIPPPTDADAPTLTPAASQPCAFMWAYRDAPGVPERATAALQAAGLAPASVAARVFGETCGDAFLAMGTSVEIELPVADLDDQAALGDLVITVTAALESIGETDGPNPEARLRFTSGGEMRALTYNLAQARRQIDAGLRGAELLRALGYAR